MLKKVVLPIICLASITTFVVANSFAWFTESNKKTPTINGSTPTAYYKSGDGTKDNPYVIARPVHLYNFAWLQYMGTYNKVDDDGTVKQTYFKIDDDLATDSNGNKVLDMKGYALPPLGTEDNPFVGDFDGNGAIITNLTISNKYGDYSRTPSSVTSTNFDVPQVIGLFGVIGATDTSKAYEYSSTTDALVHDVYAENLTIKNDTSSNKQTLAGLLAGYVNAPMLNCGVGLGTFDLASDTKSLGTYNGTTLKGVSDYALVGSYNSENFSWSIPDGGGGGQGNDWGGSIDISSFAKRITYIKKQICGELNPAGSSTNNTKTYTSDIYNVSLYERAVSSDSYKFDFDWFTFDDSIAGKTNSYISFQEGTYLPLNINLTTSTIKDEQGNDYSDSTSPQLGSFYDGKNAESVLSTNTGYIVGYKSSTNAYPRIQKQKSEASASSLGIRYSIATQIKGVNEIDDSKMFDSSNFALYMYDTNEGKTKRIEDDDNKTNNESFNKSKIETTYSSSKFSKYSLVKSEFISMLKSSSTNARTLGKLLLEGIRIYNLNNYEFSENRYTASNNTVSLNGNVKSTYQFQNGGFNFTVSKPGIITMILGTYASNSSLHSGIDLYQVTRDSSNNITSCDENTRIKQIYTSSDGKEISYNSKSGNATNLSIDLDAAAKTTGVLSANCAYYFEIPVTAGDYFLSKIKREDSSSSNLPYILYLDIGANAGDSGDEDDDTSPWPIDFVYFDSNKTLVKISTDKDSSGNYIYKNSEALFQINETASGIIKFKRKDGDGSVVYYYITSGSSITVVAIATEGKYEQSTSNLTPIYTTSN